MLPPGAMLPPGPPPHVRPAIGTVSPEPGGSVLLTQPIQGERLIPSCEHDPNPGDILRLESVAVFINVGRDRIRLTRKLTFSPTTAWKAVCDHKFFLGEPETIWTAGARTQVWFTQPPRPRSPLTPLERSIPKKNDPAAPSESAASDQTAWIGADLTLSPFPGNPTDHRLVLELEQECVVFPEAGSDGLISLNLPLAHLSRYTPSKSLQVSVQLEFDAMWYFHGATLPETGQLERRVTWEMPGVPEADLKFLFSAEAPAEPEPQVAAPAESTSEMLLRGLLLVLVILVVLGVMLFGIRFRHKSKPPAKE